ncbi:MAG TPA: YciI family protein [Pseudolysinimonas sp.]
MTHLEAYQLIILRRPPNPPEFDDETAERIQREHLAFYARLRESGDVLSNGPMLDQPDETLRGIAFYTAPTLDEARRLAETDPAVVAGRLVIEAMTYLTVPGTMVRPGIPFDLED